MKINGSSVESYGLVLIDKQGFYDMAIRTTPTFYDWGDVIQPLVEEPDISYQPLIFKLNCIHDTRLGVPIQTTISNLEALGEIEIEIEGAIGQVGKFLCNIQSINKNKNKGPLEELTIELYHRKPLYNATLPNTQALGSSHIGGYNFSQFGIIVSEKQDFNTLGALLDSPTTTFMSGPIKTQYRALNTISLNCYVIGQDQSDRLNKIEQFKKLLSTPNTKTLVHSGRTFEVFSTNGFVTKTLGNKVINFTLILNVV